MSDRVVMSELVRRTKKRFVEGKLKECLVCAMLGIVDLEYDVGSEEVVRITFDCGYHRDVIVTGDSPAAIIKDVLRVAM